jgi:hypothetical protein
MKNRQRPFVLFWLFLCATTFLLTENTPLFAQGGIRINASGEITRHAVADVGTLTTRQLNAARAAHKLSDDISVQSPMRCVSLNRMEKIIIESGGVITEEMKYLAGIQRIEHVFYFPESGDIVVAGPAEGWFPGYEGAMIGRGTLQPVCELQHLITALRAYAPNKEGEKIVSCSIDPTPEGIARLQQFVNQASGLPLRNFVRGVRESLGMQTIQVDGIPATTHAALMMVAADYRMKRIGLGLDAITVTPRLETFINNTVPTTPNTLFRWYFVPDYDSVILTEDRTGMQLVGSGVKLIGENELISATGERSAAVDELDPGSRAFTQSFTRLYPQIAQKALVFAQLRNWIDMLICAAHIQQEDFYSKSGWSMEFFGCEEKYPLETFTAPQEVEPVVGERRINRTRALTPVGGGIVINAGQALDEEHATLDKEGKIVNQHNAAQRVQQSLPEGVWWWDVK